VETEFREILVKIPKPDRGIVCRGVCPLCQEVIIEEAPGTRIQTELECALGFMSKPGYIGPGCPWCPKE